MDTNNELILTSKDIDHSGSVKHIDLTIRWGFYPLALITTLVYIVAEVKGHFGSLGKAYPVYLAIIITIMVILERLHPIRREWNMTMRSLLVRDIPMLIFNGTTIALITIVVTWLAQHATNLPLTKLSWPWWIQAMIAMALSDLVWYWLHRISHEGTGRIGQWLWKVHSIHHLPGEVYVFMHAVGHPLNSMFVRVILMLPAILLGLKPEAIFAAMVFNGFQGLVSHFNVDSRAGWFNYLFSGTELHRFHHSADTQQAKNYAAVLSLWDWLFGTWRLPGIAPDKLGVEHRDEYPADKQWMKLMLMPFKLKA